MNIAGDTDSVFAFPLDSVLTLPLANLSDTDLNACPRLPPLRL